MAQVHYEAYPAAHNATHPPRYEGGRYENGPAAQAYPQYGEHPMHAVPPAATTQGAPQGAQGSGGITRLINMAGAALSVALLAGVGVWSYRLMVRDVTGIPVIQALDLPVRVAPDDPGGHQAAYQGLAVNQVAAEGEAAGPAPVIALAPQPVELRAEDRAGGSLAAQQAPSRPIAAPTSPATLTSVPVENATLADPVAGQVEIVSASLPGVSRSLIPRPRPETVRAIAAAPAPLPEGLAYDAQAESVGTEVATRLSTPAAIDIDPSTLTRGTRLVQFGAFDSEEEAVAHWAGLARRFPDYLGQRGRVIEAATAGGRTFYRLRAHGFNDEPEARQFCSVFQAENADCIPVLIR